MSTPEIVLADPAAAVLGGRRQLPKTCVILAAIWLVVLGGAAIAALLGAFADPLANDYAVVSQGPSWEHWFGTDHLGRDVFSRCVHGAAASATVVIVTVFVGGGIGIFLGILAGLARGLVEAVIGFLTDTAIALPALIVISTVVALTGPSLTTIALTIAAFTIPVFARMSRAATLSVATENYVAVARSLGASRWRILSREVSPGVLPMMMPFLMTTVAASIIVEGALSFLGFGLRPPEPAWGSLIAEGRIQMVGAPWVTMFPALLLCLTVLSVNVLGEHLREAKR